MPVIERIWWRIRRGALALLTTVVVLAVVAVIIGWVERKRNADEEYPVYSAYLSEGLLNDAHDWSGGGPVQVVIEDTTKVGGNLRWSALHVLYGRVGFDQLHASNRASFFV